MARKEYQDKWKADNPTWMSDYYQAHKDEYRDRSRLFRKRNRKRISDKLSAVSKNKNSRGLCKKSGCYEYITPGYSVCVFHLVSDRRYSMKRGKNKKRPNSKKEIDAYMINYKAEHPCVDCGEDDAIVLCFHHLRDKKFNLSNAYDRGFGMEDVIAEIKKCIVLCQNCHVRRHSSRHKESLEKIPYYQKTKGPKQLILIDLPSGLC